MLLRPHRQNVVIWKSSRSPEHRGRGLWFTGPGHSGRVRRWARISGLLVAVGLLRVGAAVRPRWRPLAARWLVGPAADHAVLGRAQYQNRRIPSCASRPCDRPRSRRDRSRPDVRTAWSVAGPRSPAARAANPVLRPTNRYMVGRTADQG